MVAPIPNPNPKPDPNPMAGIPFAEQRLLHGGKQLPDSRTLSALGIESGSSLQLVTQTLPP